MSIHISLIFEKIITEKNKVLWRKWRNAMFEIRTDLAIEEKTENGAEQRVAGVSCRSGGSLQYGENDRGKNPG